MYRQPAQPREAGNFEDLALRRDVGRAMGVSSDLADLTSHDLMCCLAATDACGATHCSHAVGRRSQSCSHCASFVC